MEKVKNVYQLMHWLYERSINNIGFKYYNINCTDFTFIFYILFNSFRVMRLFVQFYHYFHGILSW